MASPSRVTAEPPIGPASHRQGSENRNAPSGVLPSGASRHAPSPIPTSVAPGRNCTRRICAMNCRTLSEACQPVGPADLLFKSALQDQSTETQDDLSARNSDDHE